MRLPARKIKMRKIRQKLRKRLTISPKLAEVLHQQALELWQPPTPSPMEQLLRSLMPKHDID